MCLEVRDKNSLICLLSSNSSLPHPLIDDYHLFCLMNLSRKTIPTYAFYPLFTSMFPSEHDFFVDRHHAVYLLGLHVSMS